MKNTFVFILILIFLAISQDKINGYFLMPKNAEDKIDWDIVTVVDTLYKSQKKLDGQHWYVVEYEIENTEESINYMKMHGRSNPLYMVTPFDVTEDSLSYWINRPRNKEEKFKFKWEGKKADETDKFKKKHIREGQ